MTRGGHKRSLHQFAHTIFIDSLRRETSATASFFQQFKKIVHNYNNLQKRKFITNSSKRQTATNKKSKSLVNITKKQKDGHRQKKHSVYQAQQLQKSKNCTQSYLRRIRNFRQRRSIAFLSGDFPLPLHHKFAHGTNTSAAKILKKTSTYNRY